MLVLFKTVHGSHLYGLAHENSDQDFYTVVDKVKTARAKYARQSIIDGVDTTKVDFGTWLGMCRSGVPQALEAMFSTQAEVDLIADFRSNFFVTSEALPRYLRTVTSFVMRDDFKHKRHALRLALNAREFMRRGRFNPRLNDNEIDFINEYATKEVDCVYARAMNIALDNTPMTW